MTWSQLAFLEESNLNFPWDKFPLGKQNKTNKKVVYNYIYSYASERLCSVIGKLLHFILLLFIVVDNMVL